MVERIEGFREQVEAHFGGRPGPGMRYPERLRSEAVRIARRQLAEGDRMGSVARQLGVRAPTLLRWLEPRDPGPQELRPVEVVESATPWTGGGRGEGHLTLVTAGGHRVEGLELSEVAELLEALG